MEEDHHSGEPSDEPDAPTYDPSYLKARQKFEDNALGLNVNFQTWEMADRGLVLLCDLGVCVEGEDRLKPITSGTKSEILDAIEILLDEAYPEKEEANEK